VRIDYQDAEGVVLRTALAMRAAPLTAPRAFAALARAPGNAVNVLIRIHWQALRLWLKRVPFLGKTPGARAPHPRHEARP
jgi:uncharacterized protein